MRPYSHYCRDDRQPILGASPAERRATLARLQAAIKAARLSEAEANRLARRTYGQVGYELLTADEATAWIEALQNMVISCANLGQGGGGDD